MCGKNLVLKLWPKMHSANQMSIFFNCQYLVNGLISDADFLLVDRHEWTQQALLMGFLKKNCFGANSLKIAHTHNFGSAPRIFLKFCSMRRQDEHGIYINGFWKNSHMGQMGHFGPKNGVSGLSKNGVDVPTLASICLGMLSSHMQNFIWQVNSTPMLQQVCSDIPFQIIHLQLHRY